MQKKKSRILLLREFLLKHTDEFHSVTADELTKELSTDRRTLESDIETLTAAGMDIDREARPNLSYKLLSREFDPEELKLLLDCVQVSKFLSQKKTDELSEKIYALCSKHEAAQLQRQIHRNHIKSDNEKVYRLLDNIHKALTDERPSPIEFKYFQYLPSMEKQYRNDDKLYCVCPFGVVYADENYYLIAHEISMDISPTLETVKHFRIDRMGEVNIINIKESDNNTRLNKLSYARSCKLLKNIDIDNYTKQNFAMYGGAVEKVTIRFPDHMANVVADRFGMGANIVQKRGGYFEIIENIAVSPQFYGWIFGLGKDVKILDPPHVAQGMKDLLKDTYNCYTLKRNRKKDVGNF